MLLVATTDKAYSHVNTHAATCRDGTIELDLLKYLTYWFVQVARGDETIVQDLPVEAVRKELYAFITLKRAAGKGMIFTVSNSQRVGSSE
ncbi:MAG: hypothetical protein WCQ70_02030 [Lentimicrobiaceae bacterium]